MGKFTEIITLKRKETAIIITKPIILPAIMSRRLKSYSFLHSSNSKLKEDCSNYKSKCNYKVIEPCESVRDNDYTCELYDVSIHDGANTFDKPIGKVLTLSREINKN